MERLGEIKKLTEQQLAELAQDFTLKKGHAELRPQRGFAGPSHPHELTFGIYSGVPHLEAWEPAGEGFRIPRLLTVKEILMFVQVARCQAPDSPTTTALITEAASQLRERRRKQEDVVNAVSEALEICLSQHKT